MLNSLSKLGSFSLPKLLQIHILPQQEGFFFVRIPNVTNVARNWARTKYRGMGELGWSVCVWGGPISLSHPRLCEEFRPGKGENVDSLLLLLGKRSRMNSVVAIEGDSRAKYLCHSYVGPDAHIVGLLIDLVTFLFVVGRVKNQLVVLLVGGGGQTSADFMIKRYTKRRYKSDRLNCSCYVPPSIHPERQQPVFM